MLVNGPTAQPGIVDSTKNDSDGIDVWKSRCRVEQRNQAGSYTRGIVRVSGEDVPPKNVLLYAMDGWSTVCADYFGGRVERLADTFDGDMRFDVKVNTD